MNTGVGEGGNREFGLWDSLPMRSLSSHPTANPHATDLAQVRLRHGMDADNDRCNNLSIMNRTGYPLGGIHTNLCGLIDRLKFNGTFSKIKLYRAFRSCSLVYVLGNGSTWESCTSPIQ